VQYFLERGKNHFFFHENHTNGEGIENERNYICTFPFRRVIYVLF
jgi:hypothetical protein